MAPKLEVTQGQNVGTRHRVKLLTRIGREVDNDVVLTDTKVSRYHAEISFERGQWLIRDLGSYNRTYVNGGEVVQPTMLSDQDQISLGETDFRFTMPVAATAPQPAAVPPPPPQPVKQQGGGAFAWIASAVILILLIALGVVGFMWLNQTTPQDTLPVVADNPTEPPPDTATVAEEDTPPPDDSTELVVAYQDDFSDSFSGWDDAFDEFTRKVYGNNRYQIEVMSENLMARGLANRSVSDFEVEVEAKLEEAGEDSSYGLLFRFQDTQNFYRFDISTDGYFLLSKYLDGQWTTLVDWTAAPQIQLAEANILRVSAFGPEITAHINGEQVAQVSDESLTEGNFGFFAGTFNDPYAWVSFDNLNLKVPAGQEDSLTAIPTATPPFALLIDEPADTPTPPRPTQTPTATPTQTPTGTAEPDSVAADEVAPPTETETPTTTPTSAPTQTPTVTPTPVPLPEYASRAQPLARGQEQLAGRLVFPMYDASRGMYDIYAANIADGSELTLLQAEASQPAVSADGADFAYRSWRPDRRGLFARPFSGGDAWHFTTFFEDASPRFAPGSKTLLYHSRVGGREPAVYWVLNGEPQVMRRDGAPIQGELPDWLPNGEQFVYKGCIGGTCGLLFGDIVGSGATLLTREVSDTSPDVSPDGTAVVFMSQRSGHWNVYRMDIDGGNLTALTENNTEDGLPAWSPDGQRIAFVSNRDSDWAVWVMRADGDNQRLLFPLDSTIDGIISHDPNNSFGWTQENIVWIE